MQILTLILLLFIILIVVLLLLLTIRTLFSPNVWKLYQHILGGLRLHAKCQNIGGFVPLLAGDVRARRSLIAGSIAPSELYRTSYHRHAVDGLPSRHRYKTRVSDESYSSSRGSGWTEGPRWHVLYTGEAS